MIHNSAGIVAIVNLINGKMRTPKIEALYRLIDHLNARFPSSNLVKLPLDESPLGENAWLAGFSEGDCSFQVSIPSSTKRERVCATSFCH